MIRAFAGAVLAIMLAGCAVGGSLKCVVFPGVDPGAPVPGERPDAR